MKKDKNMVCDGDVPYSYQASDTDYRGAQYDRGHLFPSSYALTQTDKVSTSP